MEPREAFQIKTPRLNVRRMSARALEPRQVRRAATVLAAICLPLCVLASIFGPEVKGAQRWFDLGFFSFQPSEILKPAIIVVWAWMLGENMRQPRFPGRLVAIGIYALAAAALLSQPDVGQTALLLLCLGPMLILSGMAWRWIVGGGVLAAFAAWGIYNIYPHARERVDTFLNPYTTLFRSRCGLSGQSRTRCDRRGRRIRARTRRRCHQTVVTGCARGFCIRGSRRRVWPYRVTWPHRVVRCAGIPRVIAREPLEPTI